MNPLYIWLATGIFFIIIEMMTVTLYGLSMSIGAFIAATFAYFTHATEINIMQIVIFTVISTLCIFIFPKFFHLSKGNAKIGIEMYVGKTFTLKKVGSDWKLTIDGVDYLVNDDCVEEGFEAGKKVKVDSCDGTILNVSLI